MLHIGVRLCVYSSEKACAYYHNLLDLKRKLGAYFKLFFNMLSHLQSVNQNQLLCRKKFDSVNNLFKHQDTSFYFSLNLQSNGQNLIGYRNGIPTLVLKPEPKEKTLSLNLELDKETTSP